MDELFIIKESSIHGRGVFAKTFIPKDTLIEYDIIKVSKTIKDSDLEKLTFPFDRNNYSICLGPITLCNHSTIPNIQIYRFDKINLKKTFITLKNLYDGDEILLNYGHTNFN